MLETITRLICDSCGAQGPEALESEDPVALAKKEGWSCGDEDRCPACSPEGQPASA
jgi:hypothetical protein